MTEEWRPVIGFEGSYEVSSQGRVRSLDRFRPSKGGLRLVKGQTLKLAIVRGYLSVLLSEKQKSIPMRVNRMVATAFLGAEPFVGAHAAHLDGNRFNNAAANLAWVSARENILHKNAHGTMRRGVNHPRTKVTKEKLAELHRLLCEGVSQRQAAKRVGLCIATVADIRFGRSFAVEMGEVIRAHSA